MKMLRITSFNDTVLRIDIVINKNTCNSLAEKKNLMVRLRNMYIHAFDDKLGNINPGVDITTLKSELNRLNNCECFKLFIYIEPQKDKQLNYGLSQKQINLESVPRGDDEIIRVSLRL